jgi:deoxyguanosine kinase
MENLNGQDRMIYGQSSDEPHHEADAPVIEHSSRSFSDREGEIAMRDCYIVIEGAIGVGKTTLARLLQDHFHTNLLLEVFEENPFLAKFYEARARYAFQTQMFFLLSRYRQQQAQVPHLLSQGGLISDYMFAKDRLFARLNLAGDEWEIYQQLHSALAQQIPAPDLIVYLQASTEVLMGRIALRDRPYERDMDREYIDTLRQAYEKYFSEDHGTPVLPIDTNALNFVTNPDDLASISGQVRSYLQDGVFQQQLLQGDRVSDGEELLTNGRPLADFQRFHVELDRSKGFSANVYFNYLCLSEEIGELGSELAKLWSREESLIAQGHLAEQARSLAIRERSQSLESELADCMAYLLKLANYTGIDLETAYVSKMRQNQNRIWHHRSGSALSVMEDR